MQRLNYSTDAIESLTTLAHAIKDWRPISAETILSVTSMLAESQKFILPPFGELLDRRRGRPVLSEPTCLPFPITAFEYNVPFLRIPNELDPIEGQEQGAATKRIALCWEMEHHPQPVVLDAVKNVFPDGGFFVASIYSSSDDRQWLLHDGAAFVPSVEAVTGKKPTIDDEILKHFSTTRLGMYEGGSGSVATFPFLPEFFDERVSIRGQRQAERDLYIDLADEFNSADDACIVLACSNAAIDTLEAPARLNLKRTKKGRLPLFEYKVLAIGESGPGRDSSGGGSHASPRTHVRRAHVRRLKDKNVLVRSTVVNPNARTGIVQKDYRLLRQ